MRGQKTLPPILKAYHDKKNMPNADRPASEMTKREAIAAQIAAALSPQYETVVKLAPWSCEVVRMTDALLAELEKGGKS